MFCRTSYTSAAYAPNPSVFVRLASSRNGGYATISSLHKYSSYVSPYATSYITTESVYRDSPKKEEHIYSNPETSSKISYYASSQLINNTIKVSKGTFSCTLIRTFASRLLLNLKFVANKQLRIMYACTWEWLNVFDENSVSASMVKYGRTENIPMTASLALEIYEAR